MAVIRREFGGRDQGCSSFEHCAVRQGVDVVFGTCASLTQSLNAARYRRV